jgi:hypothetical protein
MAAHRAWRLTVAVLGVAMLIALGDWLTGVAHAQTSTLSPHFKCYVITPGTSLNEPVRLGDQFHPIDPTTLVGGESLELKGPQFVCTPVSIKCTTPPRRH